MGELEGAYPTMVSEVILELQKLVDERGDMPIAARSSRGWLIAAVYMTTEPPYWDGGILLPAEPPNYHCGKYARSKRLKYKEHCIIDVDEPEYERDTIDGESLRLRPGLYSMRGESVRKRQKRAGRRR